MSDEKKTAPTRMFALWRYLIPVAAPLVLLSTLVLTLRGPIATWLEGPKQYDEGVLTEWIQQARHDYHTLSSLVKKFYKSVDHYKNEKRRYLNFKQTKKAGVVGMRAVTEVDLYTAKDNVIKRQEDIEKFLRWLAAPITKVHKDRLPLFPSIFQIKVSQDKEHKLTIALWDSRRPRNRGHYREFRQTLKIDDERTVHVYMQYRLRLYASNQELARQESIRRVTFFGLITLVVSLVLLWIFFAVGRVRQRRWQQMLSEQQLNQARRKHLEEELLRQEAEQQNQQIKREKLELESRMWANIGVMAGSYAHNIKNLLVRPNDLITRCLKADGVDGDRGHMLKEVRHTLNTVTERLQEILHTVRRDPTEAKFVRLDLNELLMEMQETWREIAEEKWLLTISLKTAAEPLWVEGDRSHLQQAIENLLFNARDATFEKRMHMRGQARRESDGDGQSRAVQRAAQDRKQALIAAARWKGEVSLRARRHDDRAVLEVQDNGIGMTEEVRQHCTETHFSTKRNNALYEGHSSGMGLGLSFIQVILKLHQATMEIDSEPRQGTTFRIRMPTNDA